MSEYMTEEMFRAENSLGAMLRKHTTELDVVREVSASLTARLMKQSDLTAEGIGEAGVHPLLAGITEETFQGLAEKNPELIAKAVLAAKELGAHRQALIQGNLTAEKILITEDAVEIPYTESLGAGPIGYDVAVLMVSALLGWCHGNACIEDAYDRDDFCDCCLDMVSDLADQFVWNYDGLYEELATAPSAKEAGFKAEYLSTMIPELAAAAGLEALRVLSGDRVSPSLSEITDQDQRRVAETVILEFAATCIQEKDTFFCGADFAAAIESAARMVME